MTTRIDVDVPSFILESANAVQAANRKRLEGRENRIRVEKEAAQKIRIKQAKIQNKPKKGKADPWKGAISEYDVQLVLPKRRSSFGLKWIIQEELYTVRSRNFNIGSTESDPYYNIFSVFQNESNTTTLDFLGLKSSDVLSTKQFFNSFLYDVKFVNYWEWLRYDYFQIEWSGGYTATNISTVNKSINNTPNLLLNPAEIKNNNSESLLFCSATQSQPNRLIVNVNGQLTYKYMSGPRWIYQLSQQNMPIERLYLDHTSQELYFHIGFYFPLLKKRSQSSFLYIYCQDNSENQALSISDPSRLPFTPYPFWHLSSFDSIVRDALPATTLAGNLFVCKIAFTPEYKQNLVSLYNQNKLNFTRHELIQGEANILYPYNPVYDYTPEIKPDLYYTLGHFGLPCSVKSASINIAGYEDQPFTTLFSVTKVSYKYEFIYLDSDPGFFPHTITKTLPEQRSYPFF